MNSFVALICQELEKYDFWGGFSDSNTTQIFAENAIELYNNPDLWATSQKAGRMIVNELVDIDRNGPKVLDSIYNIMDNIESIRKEKDLIGAILWDQSHRASEYFSKWIELKEKTNKES